LVFNIPGRANPATPEESVTHVLKHLRGTAEAQVGGVVKRVVLAIPSEFTTEQQESLRYE